MDVDTFYKLLEMVRPYLQKTQQKTDLPRAAACNNTKVIVVLGAILTFYRYILMINKSIIIK